MFTAFVTMLLLIAGYAEPKGTGIFNSESVKLLNLSTNPEYSDFGPAIIGDSLFFTSYNITQRNSHQKTYYDLYSSKIDLQGNITSQRKVIKEFFTNFHDGPVSYCKATGELFITQSNYSEPNPFRKHSFNLRIIIAKRENGTWKTITNFPYNNPKYSVGHPAITSTGDTLIFASNQPGGFGETDLYMSIRENGQWQKPVNLGSRINTKGKDEFPYISNSGDLIFASTGRPGFGGLDLYYSRLDDPKAVISHFEKPINSEYDDFSLILHPAADYGYFTSNRLNAGIDNIYKFTFNHSSENIIEFSVRDAKSKRPIPQAEVTFNDSIVLLTGVNGEISEKFDDKLPLSVGVKAFGYYDLYKKINAGMNKSGVLKDSLWMEMIVKKTIVLNNIYYDFDKWDLLPESIEELDDLAAFLTNNPEIRIELNSHTDDRGSEEYNLRLSQRRAESASKYLVSKGIAPGRIIAKGFGKSKPISSEFRLNRRTEFYIPESIAIGKGNSTFPIGVKSENVATESGSKSKSLVQKEKVESSIIITATKKTGKRTVVIGSFREFKNASKIISQLKEDGFKAEVTKEKELFKVGIPFKDLASAREGLLKIKPKYQDAWILNPPSSQGVKP
jgi:outer membrane protein OmpA-like peptidoglycan-associated protein